MKHSYPALLLLLSFSLFANAGIRVYELYPNIHTIGIMLVFDNPVSDSVTTAVFYEEQNAGNWSAIKEGLELSKVTSYTYAGCIFYTKPATQYRVRVTVTGTGIAYDSTQTVFTKNEITTSTATRTFYVNPTGTGISQNAATPGKLNQTLLNSLLAGDKVILQTGTYYVGELLLNSSGTMLQPIVFEGGNGVVIDGSIDTTITWKRLTTDTASVDYNLFYSNLSGLNTNCIILHNKRLYPYRNITELSRFETIRSIDGNGYVSGNHSIGLSGFFRDGRSPSGNYWPYTGYNPNTYIKFADGSDTTGKDLHVSRMAYTFKTTGH